MAEKKIFECQVCGKGFVAFVNVNRAFCCGVQMKEVDKISTTKEKKPKK